MVKLHRAETPRAIVVKGAPGRQRSPLRHCVICGAVLRGGHALGDLVCDCHPETGGDPRSDPPRPVLLSPDERLLIMLYRAAGAPVNLYRAFACHSTDTNVAAFRDMVRRLNASGLVCVRGRKRIGYELASQRRSSSGRVEA